MWFGILTEALVIFCITLHLDIKGAQHLFVPSFLLVFFCFVSFILKIKVCLSSCFQVPSLCLLVTGLWLIPKPALAVCFLFFCIFLTCFLRESRAILVHQLSKKFSQSLPFKLHGLPVCSAFHPSRSFFFIATKKEVRVYNLQKKQALVKKLETGLREISCIAIHPGGDNVIVGSKEGKLCWFDMDLRSTPYKSLKCHHPKDITSVAFHRSYPLFASCSEDNTAYVFHGMVYSDLNQDPLIVPLQVLRGHSSLKEKGVLDCKFHPRQPWLFTAGADSIIKLYCH